MPLSIWDSLVIMKPDIPSVDGRELIDWVKIYGSRKGANRIHPRESLFAMS